jgi:heat shock protein HslJ
VLFSCKKENNANSSTKDLISTKWILLGFQSNDAGNKESVPADLYGMNLVFNKTNRLHAVTSCNPVDGYYLIINKNSIKIDSLITPKMYCLDSIRRTWQDKFISGLKNSSNFQITKDMLTISTSTNMDMIFKAE